MSATALLADLRRRGVKLKANGDRLKYWAPAGVLHPEDLAALREHKAALLELLRAEAGRAALPAGYALLGEAYLHGIAVEAAPAGDRLQFHGPTHAMPARLRRDLEKHEAELARFLRAAASRPPPPPAPEPRCWWYRRCEGAPN